MTMGDRIKTRQQLLDEQAATTPAQKTPEDDRHDHSAYPHQAHDSTAPPDQDGANIQSSLDALQHEVTKLRERMAVIKQEATDEVNRNWVSPWRTPAMFELKVKTRLTGNEEYRSLQNRVRDAQASLLAGSDAATVSFHDW
ncbi:MAG: hypothetical protein JO296_01690 [Pseudonocardiales bacterium]|jgi:hypothetical protein|nr:hypothetical protein [Pseudonocardiales bacterium]MBV9648836.1 hypothetical protein [Pseudonocardiales bacterium]HZS21290.1 hypothetical protein [Pseudonocardiaceae bacterium]